jgi:S1-C subfamily serine protease
VTAAATAAAATAAAVPPPPAARAGLLVDEAVSQLVFESTAGAVVALVQFDLKGSGAETFEALGSGVVFDNLGHVVTNYHCISKYVLDRSGADGIKVVVEKGDGSSVALAASIIGACVCDDARSRLHCFLWLQSVGVVRRFHVIWQH